MIIESSGAVTYAATWSGTSVITAVAEGCNGPESATHNVTTTALPIATFSYPGSPYCQNAENPSPSFSGGGVAGTFTASPSGLLFVNQSTGEIDLASSAPGTYTVTNTIAATGGCPAVTATSQVTITALPIATFSYTGSPYCQNAADPSPTFSVGGVAGTFFFNCRIGIYKYFNRSD